MAAARSSGSKVNPATIKIIVAVVALGVAGALLAVQLGLFGGTSVSVPDEVRKKIEAQAAEAAKNPPAPKPPGEQKPSPVVPSRVTN